MITYAQVSGRFGRVSVCSFLRGGRGKTVVRSFVQPRPRLCFLVRALGMQACDGFGWLRMLLSSTVCADLDASGVRSLTSVLVPLEMVVEFLVVSLKTNLAHDKDTNTLVLSFSNRLDSQPCSQELNNSASLQEIFWPQNTRTHRSG